MDTVAWGVALHTKQNQVVCGDTYVCIEDSHGMLLASVIDGLGGGAEAAEGAQLAATIFREHSDLPLQQLLQMSHTALRHTRGAVIGLLRLDTKAHKAWYVGVGNIGIYVQSAHPIKPISKNGIIGARLPSSLLELTYMYDSGDTFVLYSDGINSRWSIDGKIDMQAPPQTMAETVLATYGKAIDDATVLVLRP